MNKKKLVIGLIIGAIVTALTIVLIVVIVNLNNKENTDPTKTTTPTTTVVPTTTTTEPASGKYKITLNNGGYGTLDKNIIKDDKIVYSKLPRLYADYHIFKGWVLSSNPDEIIRDDIDITSDVTLFAIWDRVYKYEDISTLPQSEFISVINPNDYSGGLKTWGTDEDDIIYENPVNSVTVGNDKFNIADGNDGEFIIKNNISSDISRLVCSISSYNDTTYEFIKIYGTINGESKKVISIYSDLGKVKYKVNDIEYDPIQLTYYTNKVQEFYFIFDFSNNILDVTIEGKEFITDLDIKDIEAISYISLSSDGGIDISKIAIYNELELDNLKLYYSDFFESYIKSLGLANYDNNGEELIAIYDELKTIINNLSSKEDIIRALNEKIREADNVKTTEEKAVDKKKTDSSTELKTYVNSKSFGVIDDVSYTYNDVTYRNKNQITDSFDEEVVTLTKVDDITLLLAQYKSLADTLSDSNPTIVSYYKNTKVTALKDTYKSTDYTINISSYNTIFNNLATAILNLETKASIDVEINNAITALESLESDSDMLNNKKIVTKENLRVYLYETNEAKLESIHNNLSKEQIYNSLINCYNDALVVIDALDNNDRIDSYYQSIIHQIDELIHEGLGEVNSYKAKKNQDLTEYRNGILNVLGAGELYNNISAVVMENYDDLSTIEEVDISYNNAKNEIKNLAFSSAKTGAIATINEYFASKKAETLYYQEYNSLGGYQTFVDEVMNSIEYNLVITDDSAMESYIASAKTRIDEVIENIKSLTEFDIVFELIGLVQSSDGEIYNVDLPTHINFECPSPLKVLINKSLEELNFHYTLGEETIIINDTTNKKRYMYVNRCLMVNGKVDGHTNYESDKGVTKSETIYLTWAVENLV